MDDLQQIVKEELQSTEELQSKEEVSEMAMPVKAADNLLRAFDVFIKSTKSVVMDKVIQQELADALSKTEKIIAHIKGL